MLKKWIRRARRGQAMVEYTMVSHVLLIGLLGGSWPFMTTLMNGMTKYYASIYYILTVSIP